MKMLIYVLLPFLLVLVSSKGLSNSGSYYCSGGQLVPKKHTTISLEREVLSLSREGNYIRVDVYYEFYNPGDSLNEIVGFVTPPAFGDVSIQDQSHPQLSEFTVIFNGESLPFHIDNAGTSGFSDEVYGTHREGIKVYDFVYYFDTHFKPGMNVLRHSYLYRGGSSVCTEHEFAYRLTNALDWANGSIANFDLFIDLGENVFGTIPYTFRKYQRNHWHTLGNVGIEDIRDPDKLVYDNMLRVKSNKGKFHFRALDFKPDFDIQMYIVSNLHRAINCSKPTDEDPGERSFLNLLMNSKEDQVSQARKLSNDSLAFMINFVYAYEGYMFKTEPWRTYFNQFYWYLPQQHIKGSGRVRDEDLQQLLTNLIQERTKRKS